MNHIEFTVTGAQTKFGDNLATNDITFILDVSDERRNSILGDALKVHFRSGKNREIAWRNNGKPLTVHVTDQGLSVVDHEAVERQRVIAELNDAAKQLGLSNADVLAQFKAYMDAQKTQ